MLTNSHLAFYNPDTSKIEIWDKYLNKLMTSLTFPNGVSPRHMYHDEKHDKLWALVYSDEVYRFSLSEDPTTKVPTITYENSFNVSRSTIQLNNSTHVCFDPNTGDCFTVDGYSVDCTVNKITVSGTTTEAELTLDTTDTTKKGYDPSGYGSARSATIVFDEFLDKPIVIDHINYENVKIDGAHPGRTVMAVEKDLSAWDDYILAANFTADASYSADSDYSAKLYVAQTVAAGDSDMGRDELVYHPLKGTYIGCLVAPYSCVAEFSTVTKTRRIEPLGDYFSYNDRPRTAVGTETGNIHIWDSSRYVVYDMYWNFIDSGDFSSVNGATVAFNKFSEESYRYGAGNDFIVYYDSDKNAISNTKPGSHPSSPVSFIVLPGQNEKSLIAISPNVVVYPDQYSATSDTTPYILWRVGDSPDGWTQQFRLVGDTDENKVLNGGPSDTYLRQVDSWSTGMYYNSDWNWMYSSDYIEGTGDATNGTWNVLGTGSGKQSGGLEPEDGVICETSSTRWVRVQVPSAEELTGADSNTKWYFKIFSYSEKV